MCFLFCFSEFETSAVLATSYGVRNVVRIRICQGFPSGEVVMNPPADARDMGLILGLGRSYMLLRQQVHVPQLLSLCSRPWKPLILSPCVIATEYCAF